MRLIDLCVCVLLAAAIPASLAGAQNAPAVQPSIWSTKPDAAAFERIENSRLTAAQRSITAMLAVQGPKTVENTLTLYDQALSELSAANYFSALMEAVHPMPHFVTAPRQ